MTEGDGCGNTSSRCLGGLEEFSADQLKKVDDIIASHRGKPGALIPVLEQVQEVLGYLPMPVQMLVAEGLNIPVANVYGVVTFYSFFTMVPRGRHNIRVCLGTACYVRGGQKLLSGCRTFLALSPAAAPRTAGFPLKPSAAWAPAALRRLSLLTMTRTAR